MKRKSGKIQKKGGTKPGLGEGISIDTHNEGILSKVQPRKASTHKGRKILESREPQVHEGPKQSVFLRGTSCKLSTKQLLKDLHMIRKPFSVSLSQKQERLDPFANHDSLEYLSGKNQCGLFCYGSSSKQRPFRIVMGRIFEQLLLDMYETHISDYRPLNLFRNVRQPVLGSKGLVIAQGSEFESSELMKSFRNYLLDFFSTGKPNKLLVNGVDQLITLTSIPVAAPDQGIPIRAVEKCTTPLVIFRRYRIDQHKVPGKPTPEVFLEECGPRFSMRLDRSHLPERDTWKMAIKLPREVKATKMKNISTNLLGEKLGRVHVGVQDFQKLFTPHHHRNIQPAQTDEDVIM